MPIPSHNPTRQQQLEDAFLAFNQVSEQLTDSYQQLQNRVEQLSRELAETHTDRLRQLAEKERLANRLSHLLEVMPAAVVVVNGQNAIQEFNPAAASMLDGIRQGAIWPELYQRIFTKKSSGDLCLNSGALVTLFECSLSPEPGKIILLLDVTEMRELQVHLDRQERLNSLGNMAAQLAHQIRTPLTSALLDSAHLAREDLPTERRQQFSSRLRTRLCHIERQIKDMLAFASGNQGLLVPIAVAPLMMNLEQMLEPLIKARGASFELIDRTAGALMIQGNQDGLLGALMNLANNALAHGGARVQLQIALNCASNAMLEILVSDNGPGIAEDIRERIFDPFFTTSSDGTGLGLAVVQSVVLAHEGNISIVPSQLGGASFKISLPLYQEGRREETVPGYLKKRPGVYEIRSRNPL